MNYMLATRLFQDRWAFANVTDLVALDHKIMGKHMKDKKRGFVEVFSKISDRKSLTLNSI